MCGVVLDFLEFQGHHTGQDIAKKVIKVIKDFGLHEKVIAIVVDNASANDIAVVEIATFLGDCSSFPIMPEELHFRCFGHILNIGCKGKVKINMEHFGVL